MEQVGYAGKPSAWKVIWCCYLAASTSGFGVFIAICTFLASWIYCANEYGYLLGFGLGWLPSVIAAFISVFLWPFVLLLLIAAVCLWGFQSIGEPDADKLGRVLGSLLMFLIILVGLWAISQTHNYLMASRPIYNRAITGIGGFCDRIGMIGVFLLIFIPTLACVIIFN